MQELTTVKHTLQVRQYLVEDGRPALETVAQGFCSLDLADHIEHFSAMELAALFCGEQYVHVDSLIQCFKFDDEQQDTAGPKGFLETVVRCMSESRIPVFPARATNQLSLPRTDQRFTLEVRQDQEQPMLFPTACHMQLLQCNSYEVFANRMTVALRLGDYFLRTDTQQG